MRTADGIVGQHRVAVAAAGGLKRQLAQTFQRQNVARTDDTLPEPDSRNGLLRHAGDKNAGQIGHCVGMEIRLAEAVLRTVQRFHAVGDGRGNPRGGDAARGGGKAQRAGQAEQKGSAQPWGAKNGSHWIPS